MTILLSFVWPQCRLILNEAGEILSSQIKRAYAREKWGFAK